MDKQLIERAAIAAMKEVATSGQMGPASKEELAAIDGMSAVDRALTVSLFSAFIVHYSAAQGERNAD